MTYAPDMTQLRSTPKFPFYEMILHLGIIKHQQKYFFLVDSLLLLPC